MHRSRDSRDLTRTMLSVGTIALLIFSSAWILRPFVTAFLWAAVIVISTWPVLIRLQARLWGKRGLAVAIMVFVLLLVLIVPLAFGVGALTGNIHGIAAKIESLKTLAIPPPPEWLSGSVIGRGKIGTTWAQLAAQGPDGLAAHVTPYVSQSLRWIVMQIGGAGAMILQFLLTAILCGVLYMNGESTARGVRRFAVRLAGANGDRAATLAAGSIRGVSIGIVVTALIQTLIAGTGLAIASTPGALLLTAMILFLCLAQLGPALIMIPAVIWEFYSGSGPSGGILLVFALVSMTIDNFIRPILIRKGADLPLLLIFAGVIGGMIGIGIMGIFLGPVILAVTYNLMKEWVEDRVENDPGAGFQTSAKAP
jgi:predicted PurR-regulated permease PerM